MVIKIKKTTKKTKSIDWTNLRLCFVAIFAILCFIIVIGHLAIIQFVDGKELTEKAYSQQVKNQILSPSRGTIYDCKGEILAQSITVDTISLNPGKVTNAKGKKIDNEVIANGLSKIFNITYEKMMENLNSTKSVIIIEKKVEKDKVDELKKWMSETGITAGINIDEDSKRYYPYNNLASNLIGFCGTDNKGQVGLEQRWNDVLTGTAGKIVTATDVNGKAISDEDEQYIASENGRNIYLTINASIQSIAEKYLQQAMVENPTATGGNVILMNPQSGEILAMATNPDYNLNEPSNYIATGYSEEDWNSLEKADRNNALQNLWINKAVSGTYEPGSTFKLLTAAIGLEENIVETDIENNFLCTGSYVVAQDNGEPVAISCWRKEPHGYLSLRGALMNSCNPAFMQLGQKIGAPTLYKYYQAFGLFEPIGNDIARAYKGQFTELEKVGPVELATTSFGQRFEISPLQLITVVSAICNDGILVKPKIVKQIENTDTKSIEVMEAEEIRQVISKSTSDKIKNMMQSVVQGGTGRYAAVTGYSIGGKSGTSEPKQGHEDEGYVASFIAISPIENTQIVCLVTLYGISDSIYHQGGMQAGPVASQILSEVLPDLGIASDSTQNIENDNNSDDEKQILLLNVKDMTISEAKSRLESIGFNVILNTTEDINTALVADQVPKSGAALKEGSVICLYTANDTERKKVQVPNIKGMSVSEATRTLKATNLNISVEGDTGIVVSQDPIYETEVEEGTVINVVIKEQLKDGQ